MCLLVRVTIVDKNKVLVWCLLATSAIMLYEKKKRKRKMWSKKWYLKRNISCDAHLLNELLETVVLWDDAIVVPAGKLRKLWDFLSELRSSVCERRLERTVQRPALLLVKTAQFTQFFPSCMTSHSKIAQFNWECTGLCTDDQTRLFREPYFVMPKILSLYSGGSRSDCGVHIGIAFVTYPSPSGEVVVLLVASWVTGSASFPYKTKRAADKSATARH